MPKLKADYTKDIMDVWFMNNYSLQDASKNSFELADKMTGFGEKDVTLVKAMQTAINSAESPFELSWGEAISAFVNGLFSLNSSIQAERLNIIAGKIADAIVPAVQEYENPVKIESQATDGPGFDKAKQEVQEISVSDKGAEVNSKPILGEHTAKVVGGSQGQSQGQGHGVA